MSTTIYPQNYLLFNTQQTKQISLVLQIDGLPDVLSIVPIYTRIRYGDADIFYGTPGVVYGGLRLLTNDKPYLMVKNGLTISQKVEPEQGRGSVATLSFSFIDKDQYMSRLISPGVLLQEPLGNCLVRVYMGYDLTSFPEDYFTVFRGFMSSTTSGPGVVTIQLSDANIKRRQTIFYGGNTTISSSITNSQTNIPVFKTDGFFDPILGPDGTYDPGVTPYIQVDDEWMQYSNGALSPTQITVLSRGGSHSRGTPAVSHDAGATVMNGIQIQDNVMNLMLKIMLSGWNGPWITGVPCLSLGTSLDPTNVQPGTVLINTDAVQEYGLTVGDYVIITGSTAGNDGTFLITDIQNSTSDANRLVIVDHFFNLENPASTVNLGFRSKYDTLPIACGLKNTPREVDVQTFEDTRQLFFSAGFYEQQIFITEPGSGKDLIESTLCLPIGIYSITRYGRISVGVTKPPIAGQSLVYLNNTNVLDPKNITVQRALNNRRFYNLISYSFDKTDAGNYRSVVNVLDTDSLTKINMVSSLPINADGVKTTLGGALLVQTRGNFLLNRYKKAAYQISLKVNWAAGSLIEVGDVVALTDDGNLQITNFENGKRDLGTQLYEVIERTLDLQTGSVSLTLLSNLGYKVNQRFATVAPSSQVIAGSTTTSILIKDSYGALYPHNEKKKWQKFFGLPIRVHSYDYTRLDTVTLLGFDPTNPYRMLVSPALSFTPQVDDIVDTDLYGTDGLPSTNTLYKTLFTHVDPTLTVVSGTSDTVFDVSAPDAATLNIGLPITIHNADYTLSSPEVNVASVVGTTVTVAASLGFTPSAGQQIELVGFKDRGGPYRYL